jgi:exopolysaccharide biosynthesis polyprenyl glycosylphosphotransferase
MLLDLSLSATAIMLAYVLQPRMELGWVASNELQPGAYVAVLTYPWLVLLTSHIAGLHDPLAPRNRWQLIVRVTLAVACALTLYLLMLYWVSLMQLGRSILTRTVLLNIGLGVGSRLFLWGVAQAVPRKIGVFCDEARLARLRSVVEQAGMPYELVPYAPPTIEGRDVDAAVRFFVERDLDEVLVFTSAKTSFDRAVWRACLGAGIQVTDYTVYVEREFYKVPCEELDDAWILSVDLKWIHPFYLRFKRLMDIGLVLVVGTVSAPLLLLAMLAIKLEDGGPIFYGQTRTGLRGHSYRIWKLRSMRQDAERTGAVWASRGDPRVTWVGRLVRRTRIDELPQLWNVLVGEMSFIGPRPERPEFVDQLVTELPLFPMRHWVKPGITGWAQVNYPYGASIEDARQKLAYDLYYIKHASLLLDLHIVLRTIGAVMKGSR